MLDIPKISMILKLILISVMILLIPEYKNIFLDPNIDIIISLLAIVIIILLTIKSLKDFYSIIGLETNGLNLGIIFPLIVPIETVLLVHSFQIVENTDVLLAIDLITLVLSAFVIFMIDFRNFFLLEENKQLTILKKGEKISISGNLYFESLPMHIIYKYRKGFLCKVINLGKNEKEKIKKFSLPCIKKAMLLTIATKTKEGIEKKYSGLSVMDFFLKNTELTNRILLNGSFFESHQRYHLLLQDNLYIDSVVKLYDKQHLDKKNVPKSRKLSWFTPEIALEYKLPVFTDEQADNLISNNIGTSELVNNGLLNKFYENGFQFIYFIIGPMKVSENNE